MYGSEMHIVLNCLLIDVAILATTQSYECAPNSEHGMESGWWLVVGCSWRWSLSQQRHWGKHVSSCEAGGYWLKNCSSLLPFETLEMFYSL